MARYTFSELDAATLRSLVTFRDLGVAAARWASLAQPLDARERARIDALRESLVDRPLTLLNEATIWSRAIYPLLVLAESREVQAFAQVPLEARFARFELAGTLDGALATSLSGTVEAPFLVVVEAKRGLEAVNPQWQLYGEMLAAMAANAGSSRAAPAVMYGCYTVSDTWTFVRGEGVSLDGDRPALTVESSREYSERAEAEQIVGVLKGIVRAAPR
ncbi:MAG: hypothetical protein U0324_42020 [Polyangiales bacterium]